MVVTVPSIVFSVGREKDVPKRVTTGGPERVTERNVDHVTSWNDQLEEEYGG